MKVAIEETEKEKNEQLGGKKGIDGHEKLTNEMQRSGTTR